MVLTSVPRFVSNLNLYLYENQTFPPEQRSKRDARRYVGIGIGLPPEFGNLRAGRVQRNAREKRFGGGRR